MMIMIPKRVGRAAHERAVAATSVTLDGKLKGDEVPCNGPRSMQNILLLLSETHALNHQSIDDL